MNEFFEKDYYRNKWVILDTNILTEISKEKRAGKYRPVFDFLELEKNNIKPYLLKSTYFELAGFSGNKKDFDSINEFVKRFKISSITDEDIELATLLSNYYKNSIGNDLSKISFCDCLHAAKIIKNKGDVFLITSDIHDYPITIFDLKNLLIIDNSKKASIIGFITYNHEKWKKAESDFKKSK